ncbi:cell division protein ZapA [Bacillus piscicola]|uniref:cell division protein ZapA n=1 Tax=Bacillus piscicola TaxID=1632684 RepID=UPI001F08DDD8
MDEEKEKKRTIVTIYGQQYTIKGDASPEHVKKVADHLDRKMKEFKSRNPYLDTTRLAVLTALNAVDEYMKLSDELKDRNKQEKDEER